MFLFQEYLPKDWTGYQGLIDKSGKICRTLKKILLLVDVTMVGLVIFVKNLRALQIHVRMVVRVLSTDTTRLKIRITARALLVIVVGIVRDRYATTILVYSGE